MNKHHMDCAWERADCEYRQTHNFCPHPEHACDCGAFPQNVDHRKTAEWYRGVKSANEHIIAHCQEEIRACEYAINVLESSTQSGDAADTGGSDE